MRGWLAGAARIALAAAAAGLAGCGDLPNPAMGDPPDGARPGEGIRPLLGLRVLTWNIQYGSDAGSDPNGWPRRRPVLAAALRAARPDILCVQEALAGQIEDLRRVLPGSDVVATGRDDGRSAGEHCAIFYDRGKFERLAGGTFWLSGTPGRPSRCFGERYNRICTWARLRARESDRAFEVWNTHFPLGRDQRASAAGVLARALEARGGLPALVAGDFNEPLGPGSWPVLARAGFSDAHVRAEKRDDTGTYRVLGVAVARLDGFLVTPGWAVREIATLDGSEKGVHPSDHAGVLGVLDLPAP